MNRTFCGVRSTRKEPRPFVFFAVLCVGALAGCGDSEPKKTDAPKQVKKLSDPLKERKEVVRRPRDMTVRAADLVGTWLMTMPKGAKREISIQAEGEKGLRMEKAARFSGLYELKEGQLIMTKPLTPQETGFEWDVNGPEAMMLVAQRPELESYYLGATLERVKSNP
jgi:hypothetical protein